MATSLRWTTADLDVFPQPLDDKRYEIIDGELFVSTQPSVRHQYTCTRLSRSLEGWSEQTAQGFVFGAPGVIFADDDNVAPDVVWISRQRLRQAMRPDGKLHAAPELIVEVLSPGPENQRRDREAKLKLYSRRQVSEYWLIDDHERCLHAYRHDGTALQLTSTYFATDVLETPLLPGLRLEIASLFLPDEI